jgi:hypothetical protein
MAILAYGKKQDDKQIKSIYVDFLGYGNTTITEKKQGYFGGAGIICGNGFVK